MWEMVSEQDTNNKYADHQKLLSHTSTVRVAI